MQSFCINLLQLNCISAISDHIFMKSITDKFQKITKILIIVTALLCTVAPVFGQEAEEEVFEYNVTEANRFLGQNASFGGFLFPELFVIGTGGVFDGDSTAEDFSTNHHDPVNDVSIQAIEMHLMLNVEDKITGMIAGFVGQLDDHEWDGALEEAFIHFQIAENLAVGGGQFLNTFGYQATNHLHGWQFINQNLVNSRILNEGELTTKGGEIIFRTPGNGGALTLGGGTVRPDPHGHEHEDEHDHEDDHDEDDHDEDEHHFELEGANFESRIFSADYKFSLPFDESLELSTSFVTGENGFGRDTHAYGVGLRKIWNGHDHGNGIEFCTGSLMLQSEFIGRHAEGYEEDGTEIEFDDYGISTGLTYGLSDRTIVSFRHDWVSEVEIAEISSANRLSAALTSFIDPAQMVKARIQYDYTSNDDIEGEHGVWLQFQVQWGGQGGNHNHEH